MIRLTRVLMGGASKRYRWKLTTTIFSSNIQGRDAPIAQMSADQVAPHRVMNGAFELEVTTCCAIRR